MKPAKPEIYLDNAATYWSPRYSRFGNPSSLHQKGLAASYILNKSRNIIAERLNCLPREIIFTSGGTESDNLAIKGIARALKKYGKSIAVGATEHKAILNSCKALQAENFKTIEIPVDENGIIKLDILEDTLKNEDITLVSVMYANNETGAIQPIKKISELAHKYGKIFHTDAVQAANCLSLDVKELDVDAMSLSGHKIGAQKGVGLLYLRTGIPIQSIIDGGGQEKGIRSGTENIEGIEDMAKHLNSISYEKYYEKCLELKDAMINTIIKGLEGVVSVKINSDVSCSLPTHISLTFKGIDGEALASILSLDGIYVSTGSACNSKSLDASHVLTAMGISPMDARCTIRISFNDRLTLKEVLFAADRIIKKVKYLAEMKN